jgi:dienelactone hydrolase
MAIQQRTVVYDCDGTTCEGVLVFDDAQSGPRPGVLVCHAWMGLRDPELGRAQMLAELGYSAFCLDIFGQGVRPDSVDAAHAAIGGFMQDVPLWRRRAQAGFAAMQAQAEVDSARCAGIGYCFGGRTILELARTGADLKAAVSFHGFLATNMPAGKGDLKGAILACNGAEDPMVQDDQVQAFQNEMRAAEADWCFINYGSAVHGFTVQGRGPVPGINYNEKADKRSWIHMKKLLREVFA